MMLRRLALLLLAAAPCWAALQRDLGQGLAYFRVNDLAQDASALEAALAKPDLVLDVRFATATAPAAEALALRLDQAAPPAKGLRIILVNPQTAPALVLAVDQDRPRELTVGPSSPALKVDIAVKTPAEEDRRGFEALAAGTPVEKLTSSNTDKRRFDELSLVQSRAGETVFPDEDNLEAPPEALDNTEPAKKEAPPPHDAVLERAIQIARAVPILRKAD